MDINKVISIIRSLKEEAVAAGPPTNNVGSGNIAGANEDPPVYLKKKKRKPTAVGRYGTRRTWRQQSGQG